MAANLHVVINRSPLSKREAKINNQAQFFVFDRNRVYFPRDRINWIKEVLSNDYKVFVIPWDLLKPVYKKTERKIWETIKTGLHN